MLESAANVAHVRTQLQRTYSGESSRKEMTYYALRMKFATRKPDDMGLTEEEASRVSSVNVLTAMKSLDRFVAAELGFKNDKAMSAWYERLCEFCHPNCLGNSVGTRLDFASGFEVFDVDPGVRPELRPLFSNYAYVSLYAFAQLYNACWRLLLDAKELLPTWNPDGDPVIVLGAFKP